MLSLSQIPGMNLCNPSDRERLYDLTYDVQVSFDGGLNNLVFVYRVLVKGKETFDGRTYDWL